MLVWHEIFGPKQHLAYGPSPYKQGYSNEYCILGCQEIKA
jgi:hypothetical protein